MRSQYGTSYKMLAEMFGVSKRMIMFVCNPEQYEKAKERLKSNKRLGKVIIYMFTQKINKK